MEKATSEQWIRLNRELWENFTKYNLHLPRAQRDLAVPVRGRVAFDLALEGMVARIPIDNDGKSTNDSEVIVRDGWVAFPRTKSGCMVFNGHFPGRRPAVWFFMVSLRFGSSAKVPRYAFQSIGSFLIKTIKPRVARWKKHTTSLRFPIKKSCAKWFLILHSSFISQLYSRAERITSFWI